MPYKKINSFISRNRLNKFFSEVLKTSTLTIHVRSELIVCDRPRRQVFSGDRDTSLNPLDSPLLGKSIAHRKLERNKAGRMSEDGLIVCVS